MEKGPEKLAATMARKTARAQKANRRAAATIDGEMGSRSRQVDPVAHFAAQQGAAKRRGPLR